MFDYVEGNLCTPLEFSIGIDLSYGEEENGKIHILTLGFLFFEISFIKYLQEE